MDDPLVYLRISEHMALPSLASAEPFRAIVILDGRYSGKWQDEVSSWLVANRCLYMMAWGPECSDWDDSVDHAMRNAYPGHETPDEKFVMTTWHADETLEDVFWFAQFCAVDAYDQIRETVLLHIGDVDREVEFRLLFEQSKTLAERED